MIDLSKTIDLSTTYLGLKLKNPLVASSSPLCEDVGNIRRMEDAGAAAVVLHSLFEEQIELESDELDRFLSRAPRASPEVADALPRHDAACDWARTATWSTLRKCQAGREDSHHRQPERHFHGRLAGLRQEDQQAGADALELNIYYIPTDADDHRRAGGAEVRRPGAGGEGQVQHSGGREARAVLQLAGQHGASSWTRPAPTRWCCSTASTSRISTWKRWKWCPT